jgi:DHA1 family tetracycline resistance protein-like MFS transporter
VFCYRLRPVKRRTPGLLFIFLTLLLDVLGLGIIIPVAPRLIELLQGGTEKDAAPIVGYLAATYAGMLFLFAPVLGALSDRFGRRPVLLSAMFGSGLDYFAMALVPTVPWLFVTRVINGLSGASITAASAYIADVTPPERRAAGFGIVGAAFGIGFVLGPLVGGILGSYDIHYPFYAAGTISLLNWLYGLLILPESLPPERRRSAAGFRWNPVKALGILGKNPFVLFMAGALFLLNLAQFGLHAVWVLYTKYRYGWDERAVGYSLFAVGLGAAIVQGGLARRLIPKLGERRSVLTGFVVGALAYLGYGLATDGWMIYVVVAFASLGGIAMPAVQSLITKRVRSDEQGQVQGALTSVQSLANIFGPLLGSQVFAWSIGSALGTPMPGAVFFVCAGLGVLGLGVALHALKAAHVDR